MLDIPNYYHTTTLSDEIENEQKNFLSTLGFDLFFAMRS
jgi:hypothetical protein